MSDYVPKPDLEGINAPEKENHLKDVTVLVAGFLTIISILYFSLGFISDSLLSRISLETEIKWFGGNFTKKATAAETAELNSLVERLNKFVDFPLNVSVMCSKEKNAFAFLGGKVFVTSGLIESLKSENALAFVVGHEIGHILNRDNLKGMGRAVLMQLGAGLMGFSDSQGISSISNMMTLRFGREAEEKADQYGLNLLRNLYGHTHGAEEFFAMMAKDESAVERTLSRFASTHPPSADRLEKVKASQPVRAMDLVPRNWTASECLAESD
jgi:Zn-dependent protease with chaperone function